MFSESCGTIRVYVIRPMNESVPTPQESYLEAVLEFLNECKLPRGGVEGRLIEEWFSVTLPEEAGLTWSSIHATV